jgi:hypothetical protein
LLLSGSKNINHVMSLCLSDDSDFGLLGKQESLTQDDVETLQFYPLDPLGECFTFLFFFAFALKDILLC